MSDRAITVHYAEIGLKRGNRRQFERRLGDRVRQGLDTAGLDRKVSVRDSRLVIACADKADAARVINVVTRIPGVAYAMPVVTVEPDMERVKEAALAMLEDAPAGTFKVESRRGDKSLPMTSIDISRDVAGRIAAVTGRAADVHTPDVTVRVGWKPSTPVRTARNVS